ncbi:MAG: Hsp20/alpha crystallin family protein [Moorea sp. SIO1G6]|uniref:Hsp20/alpha crystallin family protein n=1 Tax=Moorena sp. SIO1G6 TaxID=2607840 RepID=UPI0013C04018|nr:Hsp20/alpha crystallin family protein [Moorena sp. SIO1G6]NET64912.1 Hsp20/alpha crystallin family protein [Moorena sp. SIO1G6]
MALIRWDPFREFTNLQREMNRLFDEFTPLADPGLKGTSFMPAAELQETAETLELKLEIPGIDSKDLDIQLTEQAVSISGERRSETNTQENGMTRSEFRYGKFQRVIPLPTRVQHDQVKADYNNGILSLSLPKAES